MNDLNDSIVLKEKKRRVKNVLFGVLGVLLLIGGVTYAYITFSVEGEETNLIKAGCLKFSMTETAGLSLGNSAPMADDAGLLTSPYSFTITNQCNTIAKYNTTFNVLNSSNIDNIGKTKVALAGSSSVSPILVSNLPIFALNEKPDDVSSSYLLDNGYLDVGESKTFNLRMWIDYDVTSYTGTFDSKIIIEASAVDKIPSAPLEGTLAHAILGANNSNVVSSGDGLYVSTATNSGNPTYYYKGAVENNYVSFANQTWRIIRINEDGSIRLVLQGGIKDFDLVAYSDEVSTNAIFLNAMLVAAPEVVDNYGKGYSYNESYTSAVSGYYTNTGNNVKTTLENWYNLKLSSFDNKLVISDYCEQAKACFDQYQTTMANTTMTYYTNYVASFKCANDGNNKGIISSKVGLISADEVLFSGILPFANTGLSYLINGESFWTVSPAGLGSGEEYSRTWSVENNTLGVAVTSNKREVRPVINLKADVTVTGAGTSDNMWIVS